MDCSSPAHWGADTMYMFYSTGHPFRSSGRDPASLSRPSTRVVFDKEYIYFFISTYHRDIAEQGVGVARMPLKNLNEPKGNVFKWYRGQWDQPGIGGRVTPIFTAHVDWHRADADAFWGPSIHRNTYLECWVMFLNRAKDKDWAQEGIYVTFNRNLSDPNGWTKPVKILDAGELEKSRWYPQVVGASAEKRETDKLASRTARLFVAGLSKWEITFLKPTENGS